MERLAAEPRPDWRAHVERDLGFAFHTMDGALYWDESACYRFTADEVDQIEAATNDLEGLCLELVDKVVDKGEEALERLRIPRHAWEAIAGSWHVGEKNLYGRFDLRHDGSGPPKLLEYNADTPTSLFEAAVVQWDWLETQWPDRDQFNSIHDRLIEAWRGFGLGRDRVYFSAIRDSIEDAGTADYLRDTAIQAGLDTAAIAVEDIGWDGERFLDLDSREIAILFKLYPWEWLVNEDFGAHLLTGVTKVIEPAWKMVLSNKAMLALLWEMAPGHPNLLPASLDQAGLAGKTVRKPIFGREGANVQVLDGAAVLAESAGDYGAEGFIWQEYAELPCFGGHYPVIGSWVVASQSAGMGIREDSTPITRDTSRFIPHYLD